MQNTVDEGKAKAKVKVKAKGSFDTIFTSDPDVMCSDDERVKNGVT